jgi:hypothetical protein
MSLVPFAWWDCEFESRRGHGYLSLVSVVCCHIGALRRAGHSSRVALQGCGASKCDLEATVMRGPLSTRGCCATGGDLKMLSMLYNTIGA